MITLSSIIRSFDLRHIGTCPTCMRISFLAMILSWLLAYVAITVDSNATVLIGIATVSLTLLWLAHITTRVMRSIPSNLPQDNSRRLAIRTLAKAAVGAALMSATFPWQAHADSGCGGWAGNSGCRSCNSCQRQTADCRCYSCRSCGNNCSGNC